MKLGAAVGCWIVAALVELIGARVLDALGLIEGLLSPSGASPVALVPLALLFFGARFVTWFIAPGLVLGALVVSFRPSGRQRN
jgi:hypothetical protein